MGKLTRSTLQLLDADPTLLDAALLRMIGACPEALRGVSAVSGGLPRPWDVCREMGLAWGGFLAWVNADATGERKRRFDNAMEIRARILAEENIPIADDVDPTQADIAKARLRIDTRWRLARAYAPRTFGTLDQPGGASVTVVFTSEDMKA